MIPVWHQAARPRTHKVAGAMGGNVEHRREGGGRPSSLARLDRAAAAAPLLSTHAFADDPCFSPRSSRTLPSSSSARLSLSSISIPALVAFSSPSDGKSTQRGRRICFEFPTKNRRRHQEKKTYSNPILPGALDVVGQAVAVRLRAGDALAPRGAVSLPRRAGRGLGLDVRSGACHRECEWGFRRSSGGRS